MSRSCHSCRLRECHEMIGGPCLCCCHDSEYEGEMPEEEDAACEREAR